MSLVLPQGSTDLTRITDREVAGDYRFVMPAALLGHAMFALDGDELGLIGSIFAGVCTIIATIMSVAAEGRRQRRELRYQRRGSGMIGFLFALLLVSIAAGVYFATRPKTVVRASDAPVTTESTGAPISLEEASVFVSSYLATASDPAQVDLAWDMFTPNHLAQLETKGGIEVFRNFWRGVAAVTLNGNPSAAPGSTGGRFVVRMPLDYSIRATSTSPARCVFDDDDFTIVRVEDKLAIDDATTADSHGC